MTVDKSLLTNLISASLVIAGLALPASYGAVILSTGLFALSGGLTNWLAVHMLFERVPGLYGSGVIPLRFEEFKTAIRGLIMEQFFNRENMDRFFTQSTGVSKKLDDEILKAVDRLDLDSAFESMADVIMSSSFGGMLGMLGGREALKPLKEPFTRKMKDYFRNVVDTESFRSMLSEGLHSAMRGDTLLRKVEQMVDSRLDELTPSQVKQIVQSMIREHLGWLVVWGGVIGGAIGLLLALASLFLTSGPGTGI